MLLASVISIVIVYVAAVVLSKIKTPTGFCHPFPDAPVISVLPELCCLTVLETSQVNVPVSVGSSSLTYVTTILPSGSFATDGLPA